MIHHTQRDIIDQAIREAESRMSIVEAENLVFERESIRCAASANAFDTTGNAVLRERMEMEISYLHHRNDLQAPYFRLDEDPFLSSDILRMLSMMPPSYDDERLSTGDKTVVVSALALRFNMHWWSHTTSCFKESKATKTNGTCRNLFPREREVRTYVDNDGVHIRRPADYEYINGFNPTIMGTFRCNHDVQALLGGSGATDRIYYCCKYVTKTQKQADSMAAVALAAIQRREEREENQRRDGSSPETITVTRRRVASMAFNVTNKQEAAGPLAVLYLLRGSCCYHSHNCCQLPRREILRQLRGEEDYGCRLVQLHGSSEDRQSDTFRSVSVLDDYIYRPHFCDSVS
ncbi:hypothetical protein GQ600_22663 [Phytophthora cactorum]|nr:hypothetical protein GQ600_24048 [Phytophthora cactorum]KAF1776748.1 hypothetical protein GQ600_21810 [Phytophthora cactorum]KAF1778430.1 hypothetical protein GQ600_22663 [Phytophthora cactorum]